ncbi:MAG: peptidoglycan recognition family protein [Ilumatobacter sp.]
MCELCLPSITRRRALGIVGAAAVAALAPSWQLAAAAPQPVADGLSIVPRSAWAGDDLGFRGTPEVEDVRFLLVHHTAGAAGDPIGTMRGIHSFHTGPDRNWPDVAYHFFIDPDGIVYEGRTGSLDGPVTASATGGNQGFAQLVCLLGDFTNELPTPAAQDALVATLAWLADRYGLDTAPGALASFVSRGSNRWPDGVEVFTDVVAGHREMSATACPGDTFFPHLKTEIVDRVRGRRALTAITVPATTTTSPSTLPTTTTEVVEDGPSPTDRSASPPASTAPLDDLPAVEGSGGEVVGSLTETDPDAPLAAPPEPARTSGGPPTPSSAGGRSSTTAVVIGLSAAVAVAGVATWAGVRGRHDDALASDGDVFSKPPQGEPVAGPPMDGSP